jgi:hypothetical protein
MSIKIVTCMVIVNMSFYIDELDILFHIRNMNESFGY